MKTLAILAALTVIAAPAFAGDDHAAHKVEKKTEVKTEVSVAPVSGTEAVKTTETKTEVKTEAHKAAK